MRRLVLTNPLFHEIFTKRMRGSLVPGIEVVLMPLSAELQAEVDQVVCEASRKMRLHTDELLAAAAEDAVEQ